MSEIGEKAMKKLGDKIIQLRKDKKVSLRDLEKLTGIGDNNISEIENGKKNATIDTMARLLHSLGCHLDIVRGKLK